MKKKKSNKREANRATITPNEPPIKKPSDPLWKVKFHYRLCKGDHLLQDYPRIPRVLKVWSQNMDRLSPSTSGDHVDATSSTNGGKNNGNIRFTYRLCEGKNILHLFPLMDKASKVLENLAAPQPQLLLSYRRFYSIPLLVGKEIDLDSSLSHPALPQ